MSDDIKPGDKGPKIFRTRKSDVISSICLVVVMPLVVNVWKLRGTVQELIEAERNKTSEQIASARKYADQRVSEFYREIKDDISEVKDRITEVKSDVREIRVEVIRRGKR